MISRKTCDIPSGLAIKSEIYNHFTPTEFYLRKVSY